MVLIVPLKQAPPDLRKGSSVVSLRLRETDNKAPHHLMSLMRSLTAC